MIIQLSILEFHLKIHAVSCTPSPDNDCLTNDLNNDLLFKW
ncbi:hypothetical protein ykris0001_40380 [Yersinia kristensenii ATCC 33638]|nr:hypothetical protein ykris0001_40380 [Yersinia kristensenii ATCC 33638]